MGRPGPRTSPATLAATPTPFPRVTPKQPPAPLPAATPAPACQPATPGTQGASAGAAARKAIAPSASPIGTATIITPANVRAGPGTAYPIVAGLGKGEQVAVVGINPGRDWLLVQTTHVSGWVAASLATLATGPAALPAGSTPAARSGTTGG